MLRMRHSLSLIHITVLLFAHIRDAVRCCTAPSLRYTSSSYFKSSGTDHNLIRAVEQVDAIALRWGALTFNHERLDRERQRASDYIRSQVLGA